MKRRYEDVQVLASGNYGFVSIEQLRAAGLPRSVLETGRHHGWQRVHRGLWFMPEREMTFHDWVAAARLIYGPESAVGGAASLFIRGILRDEPATVDVWVSPHTRHRNVIDSRIRVRRDKGNRLSRMDRQGNLICVSDALIDCLSDAGNPIYAANIIIAARSRSREIRGQLKEVAVNRKRVRHRDLLDYLMEVEPAFDSVLEYLWLTNVERPHHMAPSVRQWVCPDGYRRDGAWPDFQTIYELDGDAYHLNPSTLKRDSEKDFAARQRGIMTLRFRYSDVVHHSCLTALKVANAIPHFPIKPCTPTCPVTDTSLAQ